MPAEVRHRSRADLLRAQQASNGKALSQAEPAAQKNRARDYEVGYAKPPEHTRFKPGQSGNARGRPKGSKNFRTLVKRQLDQRIVLREGGRRRKATAREVLAMQLVKKGVKGEDRAILTILKLDEETPSQAQAMAITEATTEESLSEDDRAILEAFAERLRQRTLLDIQAANHPSGSNAAESGRAKR